MAESTFRTLVGESALHGSPLRRRLPPASVTLADVDPDAAVLLWHRAVVGSEINFPDDRWFMPTVRTMEKHPLSRL